MALAGAVTSCSESTAASKAASNTAGAWPSGKPRDRRLPSDVSKADITINELAVAFLQHAEQHYCHADGSSTNELANYLASLRPLKSLYAHTPAKDFGPLALKAVRQNMIDGSWMTEEQKQKARETGKHLTWCRGVVDHASAASAACSSGRLKMNWLVASNWGCHAT